MICTNWSVAVDCRKLFQRIGKEGEMLELWMFEVF